MRLGKVQRGTLLQLYMVGPWWRGCGCGWSIEYRCDSAMERILVALVKLGVASVVNDGDTRNWAITAAGVAYVDSIREWFDSQPFPCLTR